MLKILTLMTVATLLLVFNLGETAIAQVTHQRGRCPIGTCANNGGPNAADVKNCSASNCKKPQGSQVSGGSKCRAGNPEFKDYVGCMDYNQKLGNTDASRYCQRQCPRG